MNMDYSGYTTTDLYPGLTSPSCEELGIPRTIPPNYAQANTRSVLDPTHCGSANPKMHYQFKYEEEEVTKSPFSPYCRIPLPNPFCNYDYGLEPAFIRKRNERERERVRCVNEGYSKLRDHLPLENKEKRISKVETLRCAIRYIKHLQTMLTEQSEPQSSSRKRAHPDELKSEQSKPSGESAAAGDEPKAKRRALHLKEQN